MNQLEQDQQHHRKTIDKQPLYDGKYLNTELKCYNGKIDKDFHAKNPPKKSFTGFYLAEIVLDSVCKMKQDDKYYPQIYLEECRYKEKKSIKKKEYIQEIVGFLSSN